MRWPFLLRAFFPSWKFFTDVGPEPHLSIRFGPSEEKLSSWREALLPIPRKWTGVFVHPQAGIGHAYRNHLQHLLTDIVDSEGGVQNLTSYKITRNLAEYRLREIETDKNSEEKKFYQFKIEVNFPKYLNKEPEEVLISPIYEAKCRL